MGRMRSWGGREEAREGEREGGRKREGGREGGRGGWAAREGGTSGGKIQQIQYMYMHMVCFRRGGGLCP